MAARAEPMTSLPDQPGDEGVRADWAAGYGIVSPDVIRYVDVVRQMPDAVLLATRNLAQSQDLAVVDADTAQLIATMVRARRGLRVLEVGAGVGYLTVQLARALDADSTLIAIEGDPIRHGQVHAFLGHATFDCSIELRLGDAAGVIDSLHEQPIDVVVLGDPEVDRITLLDAVLPHLAADALVFAPFALCGGRAADPLRAWDGEVEQQRSFNRALANDARFRDVQLLTIGDGLLIARYPG